MKDIYLDYDAFIRSVKQNKDISHGFLLGAGASLSSGIQSANDCIWEWKRDIFTSRNPDALPNYRYYRVETIQKSIQKWLDTQGEFPEFGSPEEYSFFAEKAYPIPDDRRRYFQKLSEEKSPYIGYKLLCLMAKKGTVKSVWTTNFDGLTERAAHHLNLTPINVNLDEPDRIFRSLGSNELLYVALHGDYKYSQLKNTEKELDNQHELFVDHLTRYFTDKNLIVCGYSGRDISLMKALQKVYSTKGAGRLYWCGFGDEINSEIHDLINTARTNGRDAYFVVTDGFDKTMINLAKSCAEDDIDYTSLISEIIQSAPDKEDDKNPPFTLGNINYDKHLISNLHPITFPKEVYQFEIPTGTAAWDIIDSRKDEEMVAVTKQNKIYAISTLSLLNKTYGDLVVGDIVREPISVKDIKSVPIFQKLFLQTIITSMTKLAGLNTDHRHKIWKNEILRSYPELNCNIYEAIDLRLIFTDETKYGYLSIKPTLYFDCPTELSKDFKFQQTKTFFDRLRNREYSEILDSWNKILFNAEKLRFSFPINSGSDMIFAINAGTSYAGIQLQNKSIRTYPARVDARKILHKGLQLLEPQLEFLNRENPNHFSKDFHPMRGITNHRPYDYLQGGTVFNKDVKISIICPTSKSTALHGFLQGLKIPQKSSHNKAYLIDYPGFEEVYKTTLDIPNVGSEKWINADFHIPANIKEGAYFLVREICQRIEIIGESYPSSTIIIFIPKEWNLYREFNLDGEAFNLHDYIKAYASERSISTQLIEEETLSDPLKCQINWWLSLSFYVKARRTPWLLSNIDKNTAFAGIGYSLKKTNGKTEIVLGCSHIYDSNGQGLKYKLSRVKDYILDRKKNPYLSYDEAYNFGISIVDLFMSSLGYIPSRVVVHKRTDFKENEINGITDSLTRAGVTNVDLITINFEKDIKFFDTYSKQGALYVNGYPLSRGTVLLMGANKALLWTHGIMPSVESDDKSYYLGGRSIPSPLMIKKFHGNSDLITVASEILGLTKMNWNSFDLYTKLPSTIDSSNRIAKIGNLLSKHEGKSYDYRFFI